MNFNPIDATNIETLYKCDKKLVHIFNYLPHLKSYSFNVEWSKSNPIK